MLFRDYEWFIDKLNLLCLTEEVKELAFKAMMGSGLLGDPDWNNVPRHCVKVAEVAEALCMEAQVDPSKIILAALLHDAKKKVERKRAEELIVTGMGKDEAFTTAALEQGAWLANLGVPPEIVRIIEMTGHASLVNFISDSATTEEEIMFVADNLCGGKDGDEVVMWNDRVPLLRERYPWLDTDGRDLLDGESYMEAQNRVTLEILDQLADMAGVENGEKLNKQIVERFAPA